MSDTMPEHTRRRLGPGDMTVRRDKLSRSAHHDYSPEQLRELGYRLGLDRSYRTGLGHSWDVADVMAVVHEWHVDLAE